MKLVYHRCHEFLSMPDARKDKLQKSNFDEQILFDEADITSGTFNGDGFGLLNLCCAIKSY